MTKNSTNVKSTSYHNFTSSKIHTRENPDYKLPNNGNIKDILKKKSNKKPKK